MKYQEAQLKSVSGVAVRGATQDIIWPKGSPHPFGFLNTGFGPLKPDNHKDKDDWQPLHPAATGKPN